MSWLAPLYVAAVAAVALPVLFHLLRRTPTKKQTFSSTWTRIDACEAAP